MYRDILDDVEWHELSGDDSKTLVMLWVIASENLGELPDIKTMAFRLRTSTKQLESAVKRLSHWLITERYQDDIKVSQINSVAEVSDHQEREREKEKETDTPNGVSLSVWEDFKAIRKTKKAALTKTALKQIQAQADKAGVSLQTALETCCERGWASYNADWMAGKQGYQAPQPNQTVPSKPGIDPTLARMIHEQTSGAVKPPSAEMKAKLAQLRGISA